MTKISPVIDHPEHPPLLTEVQPLSPTIMPDGKRDVRNPLLFECAWEVANKVGGIYTVIKTKVPVTVAEYGDRYCLIGPLSYKTAPMEVEAEEPTDPDLSATLESMREHGVKALYGRWLIEGAPHVLLFDTGSQYSRLDEWKGDLWNLARIPSPPHDHETNETIVFGYLVAWFLGDVSSHSLCSLAAGLTYMLVCFSSTSHCRGGPFSRMASRNRYTIMSQATYRRDDRFYNACYSSRTLPLCWKRRLL